MAEFLAEFLPGFYRTRGVTYDSSLLACVLGFLVARPGVQCQRCFLGFSVMLLHRIEPIRLFYAYILPVIRILSITRSLVTRYHWITAALQETQKDQSTEFLARVSSRASGELARRLTTYGRPLACFLDFCYDHILEMDPQKQIGYISGFGQCPGLPVCYRSSGYF